MHDDLGLYVSVPLPPRQGAPTLEGSLRHLEVGRIETQGPCNQDAL